MIRRPPRSTLDRSSAASDVYKRQAHDQNIAIRQDAGDEVQLHLQTASQAVAGEGVGPVSYTHLRAHETVLDLVCRLLLEKKQTNRIDDKLYNHSTARKHDTL